MVFSPKKYMYGCMYVVCMHRFMHINRFFFNFLNIYSLYWLSTIAYEILQVYVCKASKSNLNWLSIVCELFLIIFVVIFITCFPCSVYLMFSINNVPVF